jgi:hypothetical protein
MPNESRTSSQSKNLNEMHKYEEILQADYESISAASIVVGALMKYVVAGLFW